MKHTQEEKTTKNQTSDGTPIPADRMNKWGYPSDEHYVFDGCNTVCAIHKRFDDETKESHKVLLVSRVNTWKPISNEKTVTQLKKQKAQRKAKSPTLAQLKDECRIYGLPVSGKKAEVQARLDHFYAQCGAGERSTDEAMRTASLSTTDDLFVDDEGNVINPAKEESE